MTMGVRGLTAYLERNEMFQRHRLHDTTVLIDGYNLVYKLYFDHQKSLNNYDHMYGGNYSAWCHQIRRFFSCLRKCNIKPIVIFDGSFDPTLDKFNVQFERGQRNLNIAHRIYSFNLFIQGILPLMAYDIFCMELNQLNIPVYQTYYEADAILIQIAFDLRCPIMSNDSDFFLYNLPGGIIPIDSFDNFFVRDEEHNYIKCTIYKLTNLVRSYPDSKNLNLFQIAGFILGNDYIDDRIVDVVIPKITQFKDRTKVIRSVLSWISKYRTLEEVMYSLSVILKNDQHPLICIIRQHYKELETIEEDLEPIEPESYLKEKSERLFLKNLNDSDSYRPSSLQRNSRIISISSVGIDYCRICVEDFSFAKSCHETTMELHRFIYGLLRNEDKSVPKIKRYARFKTEFRGQMVSPFITLENEHLPKFSELANLTVDQREQLFFRICQIDGQVLQWIKDKFRNRLEMNFSFTDELVMPFSSMLFSLIFFMRSFPGPIWIEFLYAIYTNIWLCGYLCNEGNLSFLRLDSEQRKLFKTKFSDYSVLPKLSNVRVYMPRVVHFYNAYQSVLINLTFLAEILQVKHIFDPDMMLSILNGTFIYNLTVDLAGRSKPLLFLELLVERKNFKPLQLFKESLLNFIIDEGKRIFYTKESSLDFCDAFPSILQIKTTNILNSDGFFLVRAFEVTSKQTHLQSQKNKLVKKKNFNKNNK